MTSESGMIEALARGMPIIVLDEHGTAELVVAAELATASSLAFLVRYGTGFVRVALTGRICDRLALPPMAVDGPYRCSQAVAVDAACGITTGISATDRCRTVRLLADPDTEPTDLHRPGHILPVRAWPTDGRFDEPDVAEASLQLARLADLAPAAVLCGLISVEDPRRMADHREATVFAMDHQLEVNSVAALLPVFEVEKEAG